MALSIKIELDVNTEEFVTRLYAHAVKLETLAGAYEKALQAIVDQAEVNGCWNAEHQMAQDALDSTKKTMATVEIVERLNEAVTNPNAFYGKFGCPIRVVHKMIYEMVDDMLKAGKKVLYQDSGSIFIESKPKEERVDEIRTAK